MRKCTEQLYALVMKTITKNTYRLHLPALSLRSSAPRVQELTF